MWIGLSVCMYVCVCMHVCVCMYACMCMHACMHDIRTHACMYVCVYVCMYVSSRSVNKKYLVSVFLILWSLFWMDTTAPSSPVDRQVGN